MDAIQPGEQKAFIFYAEPGSVGEEILVAICEENSDRYPRDFFRKQVSGAAWSARGTVTVGNEKRNVLLRVSKKRPSFSCVALVSGSLAEKSKFGESCVQLGYKLSKFRIPSLAANIIAKYVVQGDGWTDRSGVHHPTMFGCPEGTLPTPKRPRRPRRSSGRGFSVGL